MLANPSNDKGEEFQQVKRLVLLSYEHQGNLDIMPETRSADIVFLNLSCYWLDQFTKNTAKSFIFLMRFTKEKQKSSKSLFFGRLLFLDPFFH